jgi:hypothetical protein
MREILYVFVIVLFDMVRGLVYKAAMVFIGLVRAESPFFVGSLAKEGEQSI